VTARIPLATVAATGVLLLAGCGDDRDPAGSSTCGAPDGSERAIGHPSWMPDGKRIVFEESPNTLSIVELERHRVSSLTCGRQPTVSPDGKHLALVRDFQIYVTDAHGGHARRVTHGLPAQGWADPSWSPNGRRLALTGKGDYTINSIETVGADGRGERNLGPVFADEPAWSPDGRHILFRDSGSADLHSRLFLVRPNGRGRKRVRHGLDGERPAWAPDGHRIVFTTFDDSRLRILDLRGGRPLVLRQEGSDPVWSPDGTQIAFAGSTGRAPNGASGSMCSAWNVVPSER
jgi:Tol biopolymer transport system component